MQESLPAKRQEDRVGRPGKRSDTEVYRDCVRKG